MLVIALTTVACELLDDDEGAPGVPVPFEVVSMGSLDVSDAGTEVFRDSNGWVQFYCDHDRSRGPFCTPPAFDFDQEMLIGVFWGAGFAGCTEQADSIEAIVERNGSIEVHVGALSDLGSCEMLVSPRQFVVIDRSPLPVVFTGNVPS